MMNCSPPIHFDIAYYTLTRFFPKSKVVFVRALSCLEAKEDALEDLNCCTYECMREEMFSFSTLWFPTPPLRPNRRFVLVVIMALRSR